MYKITVILFLVVLSFQSCKNQNTILLKDYEVPITSLIEPKVLVFQRTDNDIEQFSTVRQLITKNGEDYVIQYSIGDIDMRDSSIYLINSDRWILVEAHTIMRDNNSQSTTQIQGEIISAKNDGLNRLTKIRFTDPSNNNITVTIETISEFKEILYYKHKNKKIDCIKFIDSYSISVKNNNTPLEDYLTEMSGESIYGYGKGLLYISKRKKGSNETRSWKLEKVIDYKE